MLLKEGVCYDQCVLLAKLLDFVLLHVVLQGQTCLLLQVSLDFLLLHASLIWWKGHLFFFGVSARRSCSSSQNHSTLASSALVVGGIDLDYCDTEWFVLEMNQDHSVVFEIAPRHFISDAFVDYEGYFISSKGFLPTVVDIMVIWIKFSRYYTF